MPADWTLTASGPDTLSGASGTSGSVAAGSYTLDVTATGISIRGANEEALFHGAQSLLALVEGGYAVEVDAGGGQTRLVAVEPGFYADGLVEIVEGDLQDGDRVVSP